MQSKILSLNSVLHIAGFIAVLSFLNPSALSAKPNSAEDFFRAPKIYRVHMSPDGNAFAGIAPIGRKGTLGLVLMDRETLTPHISKGDSGREVRKFDWVSDEDIVFTVSKWNTYVSGVYRINRESHDIATLLDDRIVATIFDPMVDDPEYSWIWIWSKSSFAKLRKNANARDLNLLTKRIDNNRSLLAMEKLPEGETFRCIPDNAGKVRILLHARDGELHYLHRKDSTEDWVTLKIDPEEWRIVSFAPDNETLFATGYDGYNTKGLYTFNKDANKPIKLLFRDEEYDFDETANYKFFDGNLIGLSYERNSPQSVWFVQEMEQIQAIIDRAIPDKANVIHDWSRDLGRFLIYSFSDTAPVSYYFLDLQTKELKVIANSAPWIDTGELCPTQTLRLETPDGLKLEGYVTLPKNGSAPYRTVSLVHGGPWSRDTGGYDPEVQYLASLGYAVVRINYRGSSGFGKRVSEYPEYDFRAMVDDISFANRKLIENGIIDPDHLAIMGASFGGYAAIAGAAFEPDLYRCAITTAGVFDWAKLIKARKRQNNDFAYSELVENIGNPANEEAFEDISPIKHVEKIKIPIFIGHGKNDGNVSVAQSKRLISALKKQDVPYTTFFREWEKHGFVGKNRIELYEEIAKFLQENL